MQTLSFGARVGLAFAAFFRILGDGALAARFLAVKDRMPELPSPPPAPNPDGGEARETGALLLLSLLQREGRLVDFAMQDVKGFSDADIGAAARLVHDGCHRALASHATIEPVRGEDEGSRVTVAEAGPGVTLVGNVTGKGPYEGTLRHKGWRTTKLSLPEPTSENERTLIAPAEIEI